VRSTTRRTILWVMALVVALTLVGAAYLRGGNETSDQAAVPSGPTIPKDVGDGCGRTSATDPNDLRIGRPVARCAEGAPAARPLPRPATLHVAIPQRTDGTAPLLAADALGEFKAENLKVVIQEMPEDKAYAAMARGDVDVVVGGLDAPFFNAVEAGSKPKEVLGGPIARAPGDIGALQAGLYATRSSLPHLDDWSTLRDHAVATSGGVGSSALYPIETMFGEQEVAPDAVQIVEETPTEAARRLAAGEISLAWLTEPVASDMAGNQSVMLVATLPASESIEGTVFAPHLLTGPDRAVGLAYVRAIIRTINSHMADGYDPQARAALAKAMKVPEDKLSDSTSPLFDWEVRTGTASRIQKVYTTLGSITYERPLPEVLVVDRTLYQDAVGAR
jgi:NitT/TauT family transport system substrate-binding protein